MERKVGEIFEYKGHKLKVVESDGFCHVLDDQECRCFFDHGSICKRENRSYCGNCGISFRPENKNNVCFIEVTNEEKDMEKLDLTKILQIGDKVYSLEIGECIVKAINETDNHLGIFVETPDKIHDTWYFKDGKYFTYSPECTLFPSKYYRIWDDFAIAIIRQPKKGDYLVSDMGNPFIYKGKGKYGGYSRIVAKDYQGDLLTEINNESEQFTNKARYATPEEVIEFDKFLKSKGYYFDKENFVLRKFRWRAKCGEKYWFINSGGMISTECECDITSNNKRYDLGNYFKTLEDAEKALKQIKQLFKSIHNGNN